MKFLITYISSKHISYGAYACLLNIIISFRGVVESDSCQNQN